jgi:hypothetical protein
MMSETDEFVVLIVYFDLLVRRGVFQLNMHQLLWSFQTAMHKKVREKNEYRIFNQNFLGTD